MQLGKIWFKSQKIKFTEFCFSVANLQDVKTHTNTCLSPFLFCFHNLLCLRHFYVFNLIFFFFSFFPPSPVFFFKILSLLSSTQYWPTCAPNLSRVCVWCRTTFHFVTLCNWKAEIVMRRIYHPLQRLNGRDCGDKQITQGKGEPLVLASSFAIFCEHFLTVYINITCHSSHKITNHRFLS